MDVHMNRFAIYIGYRQIAEVNSYAAACAVERLYWWGGCLSNTIEIRRIT